MLVPAILYKDEIIKGMQKYFYTDDMMFETGCMDNWTPNIIECPDDSHFQYAIVDNNEKLIGYLGYTVDWYSSIAYNFGLFSFDRGNPLVGKDVFNKLEELVSTLHRVEWKAVGGNPACRGYDNFIKRHNGNKHILKDSIKDRNGNYRDNIIYEIVKGGVIDMLSIDEAIAFERQQAKDKRNEHYTFGIQKSKEAAEEHEQLAEWLEELKALREEKSDFRIMAKDIAEGNYEMGMKSGYNKAIDDFIHECDKHCEFYSGKNKSITREDILKIAEQLKDRNNE